LSFGVNLRIVPKIDFEPLFQSFKKANFRFINIGIESGSERIRAKILKRFYSNDDIIKNVKLAKKYGLKVSTYNMIGFPEEDLVEFQKTIEINIPAGVASGNYIPLRGEGNVGRRNGPPGDLIVYIEEEKHSIFKRDGNDVFMVLPISFPDAVFGTSLEIPTLTGKARISIPAGTQPGKILRMRNKGIPNVHGAGIGDQLVQIQIYVPSNLNTDDKRKLKELEDMESLKPSRDGGKNIFEKFKEALNI